MHQVKQSTGTAQRKRLQKELEVAGQRNRLVSGEKLRVDSAFVVEHPDPYVSTTILYGLLTNMRLPTHAAEEMFDKLTTRIQSARVGSLIRDELEKRKINRKAPDFTTPDWGGRPITLSHLKGRYVLVVFWAGWCRPCIEELPALKKALQTCRSMELEILMISVDGDMAKWRRAVEKYKMQEFINLLADSQIRDRYSNAGLPIPNQMLIDRQGMIVWNSVNRSSRKIEAVLANYLGNDRSEKRLPSLKLLVGNAMDFKSVRGSKFQRQNKAGRRCCERQPHPYR